MALSRQYLGSRKYFRMDKNLDQGNTGLFDRDSCDFNPVKWPKGSKFAVCLTHDVDRTKKTYQY